MDFGRVKREVYQDQLRHAKNLSDTHLDHIPQQRIAPFLNQPLPPRRLDNRLDSHLDGTFTGLRVGLLACIWNCRMAAVDVSTQYKYIPHTSSMNTHTTQQICARMSPPHTQHHVHTTPHIYTHTYYMNRQCIVSSPRPPPPVAPPRSDAAAPSCGPRPPVV